jgi:hypothetical protein
MSLNEYRDNGYMKLKKLGDMLRYGYEHDFSPFHRLFIKKIVERTNALVIAPAYMLIPFGTYRQEYKHTICGRSEPIC